MEDPSRIEEAVTIGYWHALERDEKGEIVNRAISAREAIEALSKARKLNSEITHRGEQKHTAKDRDFGERMYVEDLLTVFFGARPDRGLFQNHLPYAMMFGV